MYKIISYPQASVTKMELSNRRQKYTKFLRWEIFKEKLAVMFSIHPSLAWSIKKIKLIVYDILFFIFSRYTIQIISVVLQFITILTSLWYGKECNIEHLVVFWRILNRIFLIFIFLSLFFKEDNTYITIQEYWSNWFYLQLHY